MAVQTGDQPTPRPARRMFDAWLARVLLLVMVLLAFAAVGPVEIAWLWIAAQVLDRSDSLTLAMATAFFGILASVISLIFLLRRLEGAWVLVRRAAGYADQQRGALETVFVIAVGLAAAAFTIWFLVFAGAGGPTFAPTS